MPNEQILKQSPNLAQHLAAIGAAVKDIFTPRSVHVKRAYERYVQAGVEADRRFDEATKAADARIDARMGDIICDAMARTRLKMGRGDPSP